MMTDDSAEEVEKEIKRYKSVADKEILPEDFALNDFIKFRQQLATTGHDSRITKILAEWSNNPNRGSFFDRKPSGIEQANSLQAEPGDKANTDKPTTDKPANDSDKAAMPEAKPGSAVGSELKASKPDEGTAPAPTKAKSDAKASEPADTPAKAKADTGNDNLPPVVEQPALPNFDAK